MCIVAAARSQCRLAGVAEDTLVPVSKGPGLRCCPFQAVLSEVVPSDSYFPMTVRVKEIFCLVPKTLNYLLDENVSECYLALGPAIPPLDPL